MEDQILDYFGDFDTEGKVVCIRSFPFESEAYLYAFRIKEAGIRYFLSNAITGSALPIEIGGIGLHIHEKDVPAALAIIQTLDREKANHLSQQDFRDADHADIEYEANLHQTSSKYSSPLLIGLLFLIILIVLRAVFRALGVLPIEISPF